MSQSAFALIALVLTSLGSSMIRAQTSKATSPTTPDFGPNVLVLDPATPDMQQRLDAIYKTQEAGQFNDHRYAILVKPGSYKLDVQVGFYTSVSGLGRSPDDVAITGAVRSKAKWMRNNNATCNFWRSVENLSVTPTTEAANVWAVSQATSMRRVHVKGDLHLWDGGWSSGGFLADTAIDGKIVSGSQQQWLSRNADWGQWDGGNWNMVFLGVTKPPQGAWPERPYTTVEKTPVIREKPFLFVDDAGAYQVMVPSLAKDTIGTTWQHGPTAGKTIPISEFFIARAGRDEAASINAALAGGKHLILTPGIYHLDAPIHITRADTIVLGLGYATLMPVNGTPAIVLDDVDGLSVAGVLLDAGANESPTLLQAGQPRSSASHASNPTFLYDIFCRTGGAAVGVAKCFVTVNSSDVVGDNFWLWRADHGAGAAWDANRNANGLIVNGKDVTMYALMVEHCQEYQTLWNADGGRVYLYQSELPYDPPNQQAWMSGDRRGYASYKVADGVKTHDAFGVGIYSVFHQPGVVLDRAIETPDAPGIHFTHMVICRLSGKPGSGIGHIWNDRGEPVMEKMTSRME